MTIASQWSYENIGLFFLEVSGTIKLLASNGGIGVNSALQIEKNKSIKFESVVSLRKKLNAEEIQTEIMNLAKLLKEHGIPKKGPLITATHGLEVVDGQQVLDMELLVSIDREIELPDKYSFKEVFHLVNAVRVRHEGNLENLQTTYNDLNFYIQQNKLQQITTAYNVNVNDEKVAQGEEPIIDIYIGVNPSLL